MTLSSIKNHISKKLKKLDIDLRANKKLPLSVHQYDANDIINSIDTLLKGWPTIGPKVKEVENKISKYLNTDKFFINSCVFILLNILLFLVQRVECSSL